MISVQHGLILPRVMMDPKRRVSSLWKQARCHFPPTIQLGNFLKLE